MKSQQTRRRARKGLVLSRALIPVVPALLLAAASSAYGQQTITYTEGENNSNPIVITSNPLTLYFDGTQATQSGVISASGGAGQVRKDGVGLLVLDADNTYTGGTTVDAGTLQLGTGTTPRSLTVLAGTDSIPAVTVNTAATLAVEVSSTVAGSGASTAQPPLIGNGVNGGIGVQVNAGGTLVNHGTINAGDATRAGFLIGNGGTGGAGVVLANGAANFSNGGSIAGGKGGSAGEQGSGGNGGTGVTIAAVGTFSNSGSINGSTGGNGGIIAGNGGNGGIGVLMTAAATFSNSGSIAGNAGGNGSAVLTNGGNGGQGVLMTSGGILTNASSGSIVGGIAGAAGLTGLAGTSAAAVELTAGGTVNNSGTISGNRGVVFSGGAGTLTNSGTITGGVSMGNFANQVTLSTGGKIVGALNISPNPSATLTLDGTGTQTFSAAVTGTTTFNGAMVKQGPGQWTLDRSFVVTGATVANGALNVGDGSGNGSVATAHGNTALTVTGGTFNNNNGTIQGGNGDDAVDPSPGQDGGVGVLLSSGGVSTNTGFVYGGNGGASSTVPGKGGAGVQVTSPATFDNGGTVVGGSANPGAAGGAGILASGGAVIINESTGVISPGSLNAPGISVTSGAATLTNKGTINNGVLMANEANHVTLFTGGVINGNLSIGSNANATLTLDGPGDQIYSNAVRGGTDFSGSLTKQGAGTWTLDGPMIYSGNTSINAGTLALAGAGSIPNSPTISVAPGAAFDVSGLTNRFNLLQSQTLTGSGSVNGNINVAGTVTGSTTIIGDVALSSTGHIKGYTTIAGALSGPGTVDPGSSPGLVTAGQIDPSAGMAFNFELTRQGAPDFADPSNIGNDVLRVTGANPFTAALSSANAVNLFLSAAAFNGGSTDIEGGFYTDSELAASLAADVDNSLLHIFIADPTGTATYNGQTYAPLDLTQYSVDFTAVPQAAQFGTDYVDGAITDLRITPVPEPLSATTGALLLGLMASYQRPRRRKIAPHA